MESFSQEQAQSYWRNPDELNDPKTYTKGIARSLFLIDRMREHATPKSHILELGCNTGRNLAFLHHAGFRSLSAIEINPKAVENLHAVYPELQEHQITVGSIEAAILAVPKDEYDVVFSVAVLEHLHWDSSSVFSEMARIAKKILVIEDEETESVRHFPRNYEDIFTPHGMKQVDFKKVVAGLPRKFRYRAFVRSKSAASPFSIRTQINWWPIATAVRDEKPILATDGVSIASVKWSEESQLWETINNATPYEAAYWSNHPKIPC